MGEEVNENPKEAYEVYEHEADDGEHFSFERFANVIAKQMSVIHRNAKHGKRRGERVEKSLKSTRDELARLTEMGESLITVIDELNDRCKRLESVVRNLTNVSMDEKEWSTPTLNSKRRKLDPSDHEGTDLIE